jgi:hypothetical protein
MLHRRAEIRARWIELLFMEPVSSPLANPKTMIFMIDGTLDEIFGAIQRGETPQAVTMPECVCGQNPYLAYFRAGIQALHEALVLIQAGEPGLKAVDRDAAFAELNTIIRRIARHEIATFAALCQHRARTEAPVERAEWAQDLHGQKPHAASRG